MKEMSILDKARQLTQCNAVLLREDSQAEITGMQQELQISDEDIVEMGSVLNFAYGGEMSMIQKKYLEDSEKQIPLIFMQDVIHGYRTLFPIPLAMGCSFDEQVLEDCAEMSAKEARLNGVHVTFSPMVDLVRDPRWGRVAETTGEDPYLNGEMGKAFIRGYHKGGLGACVKHFAGYGAAEAGKDYNTTEISEHQLKEFYLRAYHECLKENPEMFMSSFNVLNGIPVNGNKKLLIDILRKEWGFDGVLVSDYIAIKEMVNHGYLETEKECAQVAANNEIDLEMVSTTYIRFLPELVKEGKVSEETVNRMCRRMLELKERMGLLEEPYNGVDYEKANTLVCSEEHRSIARKAVEKSCVLLKNNGVLPLSKDKKVVLVGPFAEEQDFSGCWRCFGLPHETISLKQGVESLLEREIPSAKGCDSALLATDVSGIEEAVRVASDAEVILVCIGEPSGSSGEAKCRADLRIPKVQRRLVEALYKLNKPMVAVVFGGRPQVLTEVEPMLDGILYAWHPGTEGGNGIANLLYGKAIPSAKTSISFPRSTGQCPIYYNHLSTARPKAVDDIESHMYSCSYMDELNKPLYPFGYGLSYTTFELTDLQVSAHEFSKGESLRLSIEVANAGAYDGEEVIQLYIRDYYASMVRPVQELKGYQKVFLKSGERKRVEFEVTEEHLKFYDAKGNYTTEKGTFALMLGNSSANVMQTDIIYNA